MKGKKFNMIQNAINIRYKNHGPIQHYLKPLRENELPTINVETLTVDNQMEEEMFLGLRKINGVSVNHFEEKFKRPLDSVYGETILRLKNDGMLKQQGDLLSLTDKGLILGNEVFKEFLLK